MIEYSGQPTELICTPQGFRYAALFSLSICLGAFVFSYSTVCMTQLANLMALKNSLSKQQLVFQLSIATSSFILGAFISPIFYRRFVSMLGELTGLLIIDSVGIIAIIIEMFQLTFYVLVPARFLLGLVMGLSTAIIPVYITSIAPPDKVGILGSLNQLMHTLGAVTAYIYGMLIDDKDSEDQIRWRLYLILPAVFLLIRILTLQLIFKIETLERHIHNNQVNQIRRYCEIVYESSSKRTMDAVIRLKSFTKAATKNAGTFRHRMLVALVVIASNQISGVNAILFYVRQLFDKVTGNDHQLTQQLIVIISFVQVAVTIFSTQIVDRLSRKAMILDGQLFVLVCLACIIAADRLLSSETGSKVLIVFIFLHLIAMNLTLGPCCIVYCSEIVEDITWVIMTLLGLALLTALTSDFMMEYLGLGAMFFIFFTLTLGAQIFLRSNMRETNGKSAQQIYSSFKPNKKVERLGYNVYFGDNEEQSRIL